MSVTDISKKPISILKSSNISEVIKKLLENNLSRLIVVEDGKPIGIITEKDVGLFLFSETSGQGLDKIPITKILKPILFVEESLSPQKSAKTMIDRGVSSLAIGSDAELESIFTKTDLVKYYLDNISDENKVVEEIDDLRLHPTPQKVDQFFQKFNIKWFVIGKLEREKYPEKFISILENYRQVFSSPEISIYKTLR